jgi:hypothetical protein
MDLAKRSAQVNPVAEREKDFLTKAICAAISRSRLNVNALEAIATALRHKEATVSEAREWLRDEGLEPLVTRYLRGGSK